MVTRILLQNKLSLTPVEVKAVFAWMAGKVWLPVTPLLNLAYPHLYMAVLGQKPRLWQMQSLLCHPLQHMIKKPKPGWWHTPLLEHSLRRLRQAHLYEFRASLGHKIKPHLNK